jgi:hypothetical protein
MNKKLAFLAVFFSVIGFGLGINPPKAHAEFVASRIIDDGVFDNVNSMSANAIDVFLNSFPNSCISPNSGFRAIDPTGYSPSTGYKYGGYVTAGQVIYDAAQAYGINPQVLITTLQKEQSLVIGGAGYCNNGDEHKYAAAVGYGCPDSGTTYSYTGVDLYQRNGVTHSTVGPTCVNSVSKAGFTQQVIRAAWLLKFGEQRAEGNANWAVIKGNWDNSDDPQSCYGGPMTTGTWRVCPSGQSTYYDGYKTIDGTAVHMDNGATAALYWYTPHFHGNQNFYSIFTGWFGTTYWNDSFSPHPNGTLVSDGWRVFLVTNNARRWVASPNIFESYGYNWGRIKNATSGDNSLPWTLPLDTLAPGTLFYSNNTPVYVMDYEGGVLKKQAVSLASFNALGYSFKNVKYIAPSEVPTATIAATMFGSQHPSGSVVSSSSQGKVYLVDQGTRRWVTSPLSFESNNYDWGKITPATTADMALPEGAPLDIAQGTMLYGNGGIYLVDYPSGSIVKRPVGPWDCYESRMHYTTKDWYSVPAAGLPDQTGALFTC